jgi:hypothetical protein
MFVVTPSGVNIADFKNALPPQFFDPMIPTPEGETKKLWRRE